MTKRNIGLLSLAAFLLAHTVPDSHAQGVATPAPSVAGGSSPNCGQVFFKPQRSGLTAIKLNRRTIGHARGIEVADKKGGFAQLPGKGLGMPMHPDSGGATAPTPCESPTPFVISSADKKFTINGTTVATFAQFTPTRDLLTRKPLRTVNLRNGASVDIHRIGKKSMNVTGRVKSGPYVLDADATGGGGGPGPQPGGLDTPSGAWGVKPPKSVK